MRTITKHIVHCSASEYGDVAEIRRWHKARGWADVGYHFVIRRDGEIEVGRTLDMIGAHCEGHNADSVGTCLVGVCEFTEAQFKALRRVQGMLEGMLGKVEVFGHRDFNPHKTCPNFNVREILR
ncbi:MAG: N-acetylmuramoyl-L-alanine amidase [Alphaproteobacteria bacterium]